MKNRTLLSGDSYKYGHPFLLKKDAMYQYNYMEARHSSSSHIIFTGMQYYIKEFLMKVPSKKLIKRVARMAKNHGVLFDKNMWKHINKLGYYPVEIKAIPEGTKVPVGVPVATFTNTDPRCIGLVGFLETLFMKVWMPTAVATQSNEVKQMLLKYGSPEWAEYAYHNFGSRSTTSLEHDMIAGYAHLTQFKGTDSFSSLFFCEDYYGQPDDLAAGHSVLATEHSITTMNGIEGEEEFVYTTLLNNPKSNIISFVGDSYDIYKFTQFVTKPEGRIRKLLESRDNQKLVIRPDSGEPIEVLTKVITIMKDNNCFDSELGGKALSTRYGLLWGDGITIETIEHIMQYFTNIEYQQFMFNSATGTLKTKFRNMLLLAAENFVFGSGTDLINSKNRDTHGFAIKCSEITLKDGSTIDVFKDPVTDNGKASRKGKVTTYLDRNYKDYRVGLANECRIAEGEHVALVKLFKNGKLYNKATLNEARGRS
jgi:nicotinamide phosphoribosyltransferase